MISGRNTRPSKLKLKELDLDFQERRLVSAEGVERDRRDVARVVRAGLSAIPDRVAVRLASESDAGKVHAKLSIEIRKALIAVSDAIISTPPMKGRMA